MSGFRSLSVEIIECRDDSPGLIKFWRLWVKHKKVENYDTIIVGYPGHLIVPVAKLISKRPVIADLLGSLYDAEVYSHNPNFLKRIKTKIADWLAVKFADIILLESCAQKRYFENKFGKSGKYKVVYTGARDSFKKAENFTRPKNKQFKVIFRGRLTPESGIGHILKAAEILKNENIEFKIIGSGQLQKFAEEEIKNRNLSKVTLISRFPSDEELVSEMLDSDLSLGQLEDNPRLNRTIPHKTFESFALGVPYLSGDAPAIREMVKEGKTGFLTPLADPQGLAAKILELSKNPEILETVSRNELAEFKNKYNSTILASQILNLLK